jgi:hypothetical protein
VESYVAIGMADQPWNSIDPDPSEDKRVAGAERMTVDAEADPGRR